MFSVYHSNHLDVLKSLLAALIRREPLADPFASELILVQSPGMAQWLKQQLAVEFGIAARLEFPLPSSFVWRLFAQVLPQVPERNPYTKPAMLWRLMRVLPELLSEPDFASLRSYLTDDADERKRYQLCQRIADVFDQYLVYRPDWIADWEQGGALGAQKQPWQPQLWRALVAATEQQATHIHRANLFESLIQQLQGGPRPANLPQRLFVFGISSLPPHYLRALQALGNHIDVHLMLTNPCRHYWGDLIESWRMNQGWLQQLLARRRAQLDTSLTPGAEQPLVADSASLDRLFSEAGDMAQGNPLLVSMGKQGRDHLSLLVDLQPNEFDAFVEIQPDNLLHLLQSDILDLQDRSRETEKYPLAAEDESLVIHACHSPMREVEVLHDALLARFAADPTLKPRDVVVMVADINSYSPFIQAVFGSAAAERHIPFSISDRSAPQESPLLQSFLTLLRLPELRCSAPELLSLLAVPEVLAAQGLEEADLLQMQGWIREASIRWGLDSGDASRFSLDQMPANTWQHGVERMLLGFAMASDEPVADILPYREIEGQDAARLGRLSHFLNRLRWLRDELPQARPVSDWGCFIDQLLLEFYQADEEGEAQLELIRQTLRQLRDQLQEAGYQEPLSLAVLRDHLQSALTGVRSGQQFLAGRVNFCTLMPMRSIPFKMVCLLGMNDGVYPRAVPPLGFDLMAEAPRRGDRSRREDDRYLFLEALLAAEQHLYLSYVARSSQDNSEKEPSVLLAELLDYCQSSLTLPELVSDGAPADESDGDEAVRREAVARRLIRHEALVPYDARYFDGQAPESHAAEWAHRLPPDEVAPPFMATALPLAPEWYQQPELELADLLRFFRNPVAGFFERTLRVQFRQQEQSLDEDEPFAADALDSYRLRQLLLEARLQDETALSRLRQRLQLSGQLPVGAFGQLQLDEAATGVAPLCERLQPLLSQAPSRQLFHLHWPQIQLPESEPPERISGATLLGSVSGIHEGALLRYRVGSFSAPHLLRAWLEHLALCASSSQPPAPSHLLGLKEHQLLRPVAQAEARQQLVAWLEGYLLGLTRPLPLLPQSAWCWVKEGGALVPAADGAMRWQRHTDAAQLAKAAEKMRLQFEGSDFAPVPGEGEDPYVHRVFPSWTPELQQDICDWGERLLVPLYAHLEEAP